MPTRSTVRDLTRPVHVDHKLFQRAISRNITLTVSVVILVALAVALIGLPVKDLIASAAISPNANKSLWPLQTPTNNYRLKFSGCGPLKVFEKPPARNWGISFPAKSVWLS